MGENGKYSSGRDGIHVRIGNGTKTWRMVIMMQEWFSLNMS